MKRILFYASPKDISYALHRLDAICLLKFITTDNRTTPDRKFYIGSKNLPNPGIATHATGSGSTTYLVSFLEKEIHQREIDGSNGVKRWTISNTDNESSFMLTMGGLWNENVLLQGVASTIHKSGDAQKLMRCFAQSLKSENFDKSNLHWIGPEAFFLMKSGVRLTPSENAPPEYDFQHLKDIK